MPRGLAVQWCSFKPSPQGIFTWLDLRAGGANTSVWKNKGGSALLHQFPHVSFGIGDLGARKRYFLKWVMAGYGD